MYARHLMQRLYSLDPQLGTNVILPALDMAV